MPIRPRRRRQSGTHRVATLVLALPLVAASVADAAEAGGPGDEPLSPARWIAKANEALLPGDSMVARVRIVTHDGFGGTSVDEMDMIRSDEGDVSRTLIEVEAPEVGEGTAYEIVARPERPLERWVWLPAVRRLRKITGVRRTDPFLGTEFTYEDLGLALPVERRGGTARLVGTPPDRLVELESPPYHYYARVVTRIDPATGLPRTALFYDRAGQLFREQRFADVRTVGGRPFPMRIEIRDRLTGASSVLTFESVRFDVDVSRERFAASAIRRRLADSRKEIVPDPPEARAD